MTIYPAPTAVVEIPAESSIARPVTIWLLVQLAGFLAILFQLRCWRGDPHDDQALIAMLAWQVATSSLLFTRVITNQRAAIAATLCVVPFAQLAGVLAAARGASIARGLIALLCWMTTLALFAGAFRSRGSKAIISSVAASLSIGGAALAYVQGEFSDVPESSHAAYGPLMATIAVARSGASSASNSYAWIFLTVSLLAAVAALAFSRRAASHEVTRFAPSYPHVSQHSDALLAHILISGRGRSVNVRIDLEKNFVHHFFIVERWWHEV